jgi:hypothetical protein
LISVLFLDSSFAYIAKNLIEIGNMVVINSYGIVVYSIKNTTSRTEPFSLQGNMQSNHEITSRAIIHSLENITENSQITKSNSANSQGVDTKTYKIKPANPSSKVYEQNQINKLNMNKMKWESELNSSTKLGQHNSISNPKFR